MPCPRRADHVCPIAMSPGRDHSGPTLAADRCCRVSCCITRGIYCPCGRQTIMPILPPGRTQLGRDIAQFSAGPAEWCTTRLGTAKRTHQHWLGPLVMGSRTKLRGNVRLIHRLLARSVRKEIAIVILQDPTQWSPVGSLKKLRNEANKSLAYIAE
jgi:hypothetical protein